MIHFPDFHKEGGGADGKITRDESPAFRADVGRNSDIAGLHSTHKSVLAARLQPERLAIFD